MSSADKPFRIAPLSLLLVFYPASLFAIDQNNNQQSDIWEELFQAYDLPANGDPDRDGWDNSAESLAGSDPFDPNSHPTLTIQKNFPAGITIHWKTNSGKNYQFQRTSHLHPDSWTTLLTITAERSTSIHYSSITNPDYPQFYRINILDRDTDSDGVNDWEEFILNSDPTHSNTDRSIQADEDRIISQLNMSNTITAVSYRDESSENWPSPAVIAIRREGGLKAVTVNVALSGTATQHSDYTIDLGPAIEFSLGQKEVFLPVTAILDEINEGAESVTLTLLPGNDYTLGDQDSATVFITDGPSSVEAARLLIQAAFGPSQDAPDDPDQIPENVEEVMTLGIEGWIDDQVTRPIGTLTPFIEWANTSGETIHNDIKKDAWWGRAMELRKLRPDASAAEEQLPDPLRQRMAFALSQIFVVSSKPEALGSENEGLVNYYDMLLQHSFGNYRDILYDVSMHPCMGIYLSSLGNQKPDPANNVFPDENYAREIMQLFSIGLWELNPDGSQKLQDGQPIPTYDNEDITNFARIFTGIAFGGSNTTFALWPRDFTQDMGTWDAFHDLDPKNLLNGVTTPARTASPGNTGTATLADINAAIDNLFHHPNVGPFIGKLLIQRFITSNPSPEYIARISAVFNDNGSGTRGDLGAVLKAILMDPEARDQSYRDLPTHGKLREPFLRCVNLSRALNASSPSGWYYLDAFELDHAQEPFESPSVFNFFLPSYSPPGALAQRGLVAPEFQIMNATTITTAQNYYRSALRNGFHRWGAGSTQLAASMPIFEQEMRLNVPEEAISQNTPSQPALPPEPLIRRLDLALTGGTLRPENYQIISAALRRIGPGSGWRWHHERLQTAITLIMNSAECAILR